MVKKLVFLVVMFCLIFSGFVMADTASTKEITVWHIWPDTDGNKGLFIKKVAKDFEQSTGIKVNLTQTDQDSYKTKIRVAIAGGNPPDVFSVWSFEGLYQFVRPAQVYDITKDFNAKNYKASFIPALLQGVTYNGKIYAIPIESAIGGVWYNKDIYAKYNLNVPKTWDEFANVCETLKKNGIKPMTVGMNASWTGLQLYMYLVDRAGGEKVFDSVIARKAGFTNPAFVKANQTILDMVKNGWFNDDLLGVNYDESSQLQAQGKTCMYIMGSWHLGMLKGINPKGNWGFFPFPTIAGGKGNPTNMTGGAQQAFAVAEASKNKKEAVDFIKFMCSEAKQKEFFAMTNSLATSKTFMPDDAPEILKDMQAYMTKANHMVFWYDQFLPAPVANAQLQTLQKLFGGAISAQDAAKEMDQALVKEMGLVKK